MHTNNHELPAMARKFFPKLTAPGRAVAHEVPRAAPPHDRAAGEHRLAEQPVPPSDIASSARCSVKGCVYPATELQAGLCLRHFHQDVEPQFFHSRQPSLRLLEAALYGMPTEDEERRIRLRRHRKAMRQSFLKGVS
jgi:hypothetical protein